MPEIKGKIIRILDRNTVIINLGSEHGITENTIFSILAKPEIIYDISTSKELGSIVLVKGRVKASLVSDKFTVATSKWAVNQLQLSTESLLSNILGETNEIGDSLNILDSDITPLKAVSDEPIKIGDLVKIQTNNYEKEQLPPETEISSDNNQIINNDNNMTKA